ncbi:MAG: glycoside hydrolase family 28 protein [Thermoguttaceae bacterium]|jgi:polygalacturonase|nr:glycoside hydrolase family 28 protein [Thermoguttaceae bacterium]
MIQRLVLSLLALAAALAICAGTVVAGDFDVRDFGAAGDGETLDTKAIQAAIDKCAAEGGGRVVLAGGRVYLSGGVVLRSNVTLFIDAGSVLRGSLNKDDYPDITPQLPYLYTERFTRYLIYAERERNIGIAGQGTIDGQGTHEVFDYKKSPGDKDRPYILRFVECTNVLVRDVTMLESARWCSHYLACDDVVIEGITIICTPRANRDGIDIDSCNRVRIANCRIETGDDAIVLKATAHRPCKNVTVTNCNLSSQAAAFKLGTESNGGFENIVLSNCTIYDTGYGGISLLMVDGGTFDRVSISNVVMDNVAAPIVIRLGNRARPMPGEDPPGVGSMRNIIISGVQARGAAAFGCFASGIPGEYIENLTLRDIRIEFAGGGTLEQAKAVLPERETQYPSGRTFGSLPAYGLFLRHIRNLTIDGLDLSYDSEVGEQRPALVLDDVIDANLTKLRVQPVEHMPAVRLVNCQGVLLHGCRADGAQGPFVGVEGDASRDIAIVGNDLSHAQPPVVVEETVPEGAVRQR